MTRYYLQTKKTSLSYGISDTETAMRLTGLYKLDGTSISAADIGDYMTGTFDPGTSKEEIFSIASSGVTVNADGTVDITGVVRGLREGGTAGYSTGGYSAEHGAGAVVVFSNNPQLYNQMANKSNDNTFTGQNIFNSFAPQTNTDPVAGNDLTRLSYVQALVLGTLTTINVIVPATAGATITIGQLVYFDETDNKWKLCDADTATTVQNVLLGIAQGSGTDGNPILNGVLLQGVDENQSGLTQGDVQYASNTAGSISSTPGTTEVTVGIAKSATELYFAPRFNQMLTENQQDAMDFATNPSATNPFLTGADLVGVVSPYVGSSAPTGWLLCDGSAVSRTTYAALFAIAGITYGVGDGSTTFNLPDLRSRSVVGKGTGTKVATFSSRSGNVITVTGLTNVSNNEFQTGQAVLYDTTSGAISGLTDNTTYYVVRVTNTSFSLSTTLANAQNGTVITLSSDGTGTQTFTQTLTARTVGDTGGEENHAMSSTELLAHTHAYKNVYDNSANLGAGTNTYGATSETSSKGGNVAMNVMNPFVVLNYIVKY